MDKFLILAACILAPIGIYIVVHKIRMAIQAKAAPIYPIPKVMDFVLASSDKARPIIIREVSMTIKDDTQWPIQPLTASLLTRMELHTEFYPYGREREAALKHIRAWRKKVPVTLSQ